MATTLLQLVLAYGTLILIVWTFVDALRFSREDYRHAERMPRVAWLTAIGFCFGMLLWLGAWRADEPFGPRSLMWFASVAVCAVYFLDMRPRLLNARIERNR